MKTSPAPSFDETMQTASQALLPTREGKPEDKIDVAAVVGQFLRDVDLADLVVELVQNDLDAGATRTAIDFGEHALTCEGDGRPIDNKGWLRLESVLAAGGDVEAKKDGIGSKNHGLRSAYLLADRIGVQSAGLRADLTVRGDLECPERFKPAYWPRTSDRNAPTEGVRITVPYRTAPLRRPDGDNTALQPPTSIELDDLWRAATSDAPERFLTASRPGARWTYTLVLSRHGHPKNELIYESKPVPGGPRGLWLRTCKVRIDGKPQRTFARRHALRFPISVTDGGKIPRLFGRSDALFGELSWRVSSRNRPLPSIGGLRYPIAFMETQERSGHAFDISAPFIAGRARHGLSNDPRNVDLITQGKSAMAKMGSLLAKAYGPDVGQLVRSVDPQEADAEAEARLVHGWLDHGGLSLVVFGKGDLPSQIGVAPSKPGVSVLLARAAGRGASDATLCALAASRGPVISPEHGDVILSVLEKLAAEGDRRVTHFSEVHAARLILVEKLKVDEATSARNLNQVVAVIGCLDGLRRAGGIPGTLVAELTSNGALPTCTGQTLAWSKVRFHDQPPPEVPGVRSPPVIHPALIITPVLSQGALALKKFDLNEFVGHLDFSTVASAGRQLFFDWLRKAATGLRATTLKRIAVFPIWPGGDGQYRELDAYCRPKTRRLQDLLGATLLAPAPPVVALLAARDLPQGALKLRHEPTDDELVAWHAAEMAMIERTFEKDPTRSQSQLDALEAGLEWLRGRSAAAVQKMGPAHKTLAQDGELRAVATLHVPTEVTLACGLSPQVLTRPRRAKLYLDLGAQLRPGPGAIITALRSDPDLSKLYIRLEAYKQISLSLSDLSREPIIPIDSELRAADSLAFAGEPDHWGSWKMRLRASDVAQNHAVLAEMGVIRAQLTRDNSLGFFRWLAAQPRALQRNHQTQIARHWRDKVFGPLSWAHLHSDVPCLPVTGRDNFFELVSLSTAEESSNNIYLDDFPEIREAVLKESKARLTLIKAVGFQYSTLDVFQATKVPSLRRTLRAPRAVCLAAEVRVSAELDAELARLQTGLVLANLKTKLPLYGVPTSDLRPEWQKHLKALKGVRISQRLTAIYRLLGRDFIVPVLGGIDQSSSLICLSQEADHLNEFYALLAGHLFKSGGTGASAWGLMRAARDRRRLTLFEAEETSEKDEDNESPLPTINGQDGDLHTGHGLSKAKLEPIVPNPKPLADISDTTQLSGQKRVHRAASRNQNDGARNSVEEEEQKRQLKHDHYGYHCQACLGEMDVLKAAPPGTYVFAPGYRQRLLHAHHAHQQQNKGMIGGRNLLILCEYHHRIWGDRLSRDKVLEGLLKATKIRRHFPTDPEGRSVEGKEGVLAKILLDVAPFEAKLYFTKLHADAWQPSAAVASTI